MGCLFDAHCHLQDPRMSGSVHEVVAQAHTAGVRRFSVHGTCEDDWCRVRELAQQSADITSNFGLHPWYVANRTQHWLQRLREALEAVPNAGLGECGLDKAHQGADIATQEQVFWQQLQLGKELGRPISVHCVRAYGKVLEAIQQLGPFPAGLVLHSFAGPAEVVVPLAKVEGVHFSISGHITKLPVEKAEAMLKQIPMGRLLLETDSPDGLPQVSDAHLARNVEAAAGCCLRVLTASDNGSTDDRGLRNGSPGASSSCSQPASGQRSSPAGDGSTQPAGPNGSSGDGDSHHSKQSRAPAQATKGAGSTAAAPVAASAAANVGSNHSTGSGGTGTVPLDWRCPLDVATADGASIRVEHPRQLLNQPANLRIILHLVAAMRGQDAQELAEASASSAARLFDCKSHGA